MTTLPWMHRLTWISIGVLVLCVYVSISLSAISHIAIAVPAVYFLAQAFSKRTVDMSASMWALLGLILISIISILANPVPLKTLTSVKYYAMGLLSVWAFRAYFKEKVVARWNSFFLKVFLIAASVATLSGIIALYTQFHPLKFKQACHLTRACGFYGMYMTYGYGIGFFCILVTGLWMLRREISLGVRSRWLSAALIVNLAGLVLSGARGALFGYLLSFPVFFLRRSWKWVLGILAFVIVAGVVAYATSERVSSLFTDVNRVESVKTRVSIYQAAWYSFQEHPWLGVGYKSFEPLVGKIKERYGLYRPDFEGQAHNNFIEHLASTGILGFLLLLAFHIAWAREMLRRRDVVGNIVLGFILYLFISGQTQYTMGDGENMFLIMFVYAMSQSVPRWEISTRSCG